MNQYEAEIRNDVLVYTSAPITKTMEVTGPISVTLFASTTANDIDFTAKLVDVYPDGRAINLCDGIIRARYRESLQNPIPIEPDCVYSYSISLGSISNVFDAGHRIRVEIASSNFPMFNVNPGHGGEINNATFKDIVVATQHVFHDSLRPSHILLPVVPI
jgi:putative CocE/NonD family hydrolase